MVIACALTGCGDGFGPEIHRLLDARARWEGAALRSYRFHYDRTCFCLPAANGPAVVTVRDGVVTNVELLQSSETIGEPILAEFPTIEDLFDLIATAIDGGWDKLEVEYDEALGFPTTLAVDPSTTTADDEAWYNLSALTELQ